MRLLRRTGLATVASASILGAAIAVANEDYKPGHERNETATQPAPGQITKPGAGQLTFDTVDRDRDGYISGMELEQQMDIDVELTELDRNADGQLDRAEFSAFEIRQTPAMPEKKAAPIDPGVNPSGQRHPGTQTQPLDE